MIIKLLVFFWVLKWAWKGFDCTIDTVADDKGNMELLDIHIEPFKKDKDHGNS